MLKNIKSRRQIIKFEIAYKLAATALLLLIAGTIVKVVFKVAQIRYLTNEYILKAIVNPVTIIAMIFGILIFVAYCTFEMAYMTVCFENDRNGREVSITDNFYTAVKKFKNIIKIKNISMAFFIFMLIAAINIAIGFNIIYSQNSVNFINDYILHFRIYITVGCILLIAIVYYYVVRGIFSYNIFILEGKNFKESYKKSAKMVRKHKWKIISVLIAYNFTVFAIIAAFYFIISVILIAGVKILDMAYIGSAVYLSVLKYIRKGMKLFFIYIAVPISYILISNLYYDFCDQDSITFETLKISGKKHLIGKKIYNSVVFVSIVICVIHVILSFNDNPFEKIAIFHETKITAHRGASKEKPENTLSAFQKALDDLTDYVELDVRLSKDGEVVVFHDDDLYRLTGEKTKISSLTLEELKTKNIDGESIPTLEEVFKLVGYRASYNIEIKSCSDLKLLTDKTLELMKKYNLTDRCVITSADYNALKFTKEINNNIQTGYIVAIFYGDFYDMKDVDFFSVNAAFLSKRIIDDIHRSGKQIHAWTVNSESSIKNLTNKGVDNIITDDPVLARETIYSRDTSDTLKTMIKYVLNR